MLEAIIDSIKTYPFFLAFFLGIIPALIWLWFWLKEDRHPEPPKILTMSFVGGILAVVSVLPFERLVYVFIPEVNTLTFIIWAIIEEVIKFVIVYGIALRTKNVDEPVDDIIYLIRSLGFATYKTDTVKVCTNGKDGPVECECYNFNCFFNFTVSLDPII